MSEHRAFLCVEYDSVGHGECLDCDWVGPTHHGILPIVMDCRLHEEEMEDEDETS